MPEEPQITTVETVLENGDISVHMQGAYKIATSQVTYIVTRAEQIAARDDSRLLRERLEMYCDAMKDSLVRVACVPKDVKIVHQTAQDEEVRTFRDAEEDQLRGEHDIARECKRMYDDYLVGTAAPPDAKITLAGVQIAPIASTHFYQNNQGQSITRCPEESLEDFLKRVDMFRAHTAEEDAESKPTE